jgi:hypothetical protein
LWRRCCGSCEELFVVDVEAGEDAVDAVLSLGDVELLYTSSLRIGSFVSMLKTCSL